MHHRFYLSQAIDALKTMESESVQCVVTSPPYWNLRDYKIDGQIGLEETPEEYVQKIVEIFREVWRVLKSDGTVWINLGDTYSNGGNGGGGSFAQFGNKGAHLIADKNVPARTGNRRLPAGLKPKDLVGIPWMVAFALRSDGWYLRQDLIWEKPNSMPESVTDRCTKAHEYLFLLSKSEHYFYNNEAIKEPGATTREELLQFGPRPDKGYPGPMNDRRRLKTSGKWATEDPQSSGRRIVERVAAARAAGAPHDQPWGSMRNKRSVWTIATESFKGAHFAVMPTKLVEPCILAGTRPGDTVLDPFGGSGTVSLVAQWHQRNSVYIDLNPAYLELAIERCGFRGLANADTCEIIDCRTLAKEIAGLKD